MALAPAAVFAEEPARVREYVDVFTSRTPGSVTGRNLRIDHVNPSAPEAKPPAAVHELVQLHPGTSINTFAVAQCTASDQELVALGPAACPNGTRVGSGEIHLDTGVPGPTRIAINDVTILNAANQLIFVLESRGTPAPIRFVVRAKVEGSTLDIALPSAPGTDGPTATFEVLNFRQISTIRDGRRLDYITTPPACPASGHWTNRFTFTYWDGIRQTYTAHSPCTHKAHHGASTPRDNRPPRISIRGVPATRCLSASFQMRLAIDERGSGLSRTWLYLNGRQLRSTAQAQFSARIPVRRLQPGRHRLTIVAIDRAGNRATRSVRFRRC